MRFRSALRLGGFACLLYLLSTNVDNYFEGQALPSQLTARNITITVRTIARGLSYLLTFLFAANTIGLTGETQSRWYPQRAENHRLLCPSAQEDTLCRDRSVCCCCQDCLHCLCMMNKECAPIWDC